MDYNDNDYEGQNLHLAGEESSKVSPILRPFALPKFDFDDTLHGHLRFDSLVENEVFLGISSQEDNQWIEDFSRGSSGIEFSSSAADSCALPRHINVWSEATSSESVEMLLKAVRQEEMVPGENMIEESDPGGQLGSLTKQMENNSRQEDKIEDVVNRTPFLSPVEVQGDFSSSNQSRGVEVVHSECTLQAQETDISSYGVCIDSKEGGLTVASSNSDIDMKRTSDNEGENRGLVNESLCNLVQENLPVLGIETDNTESSCQKIAVSVRESVDQDKTSDTSFIRSSSTEQGISDAVERQKKLCDNKDERLSDRAVETYNPEMHCSLEIPSEVESSKEEYAVEILAPNFSKASGMAAKGESASTDDRCNEAAFVVEPAGVSELGAVVFSSGMEIKQLSEGHIILSEKPPVSLQGEGCIERLGVVGSEEVSPKIGHNTEWKQVPVIQPSDQHKSHGDDADVRSGRFSSLEAPHASFESSMFNEALSNSFENNSESNINDANGPANSSGPTLAGECCEEKSVTDNITDARENSVSTQVDAQESDLGVSSGEKEDKKLPLESSDMDCDDNEKEARTTFSGEAVKLNVGTASGSQPTSGSGYCSVLNTEVEDTKLTSSRVEGDELVDCPERSPPSCDTGYAHQSKETESEAPKEPNTSVSKEALQSNVLAPAIGAEKATLLDSAAAGGTQTNNESVPVVETSSVAMPDEACKELSEKMEHPASDLIVQDDGAEAAPTEKPVEIEREKSDTRNFSTVLVTSCSVEIDKSNKSSVPDASGTDLSQSEINKQESLKRNDTKNIGEVLQTSTNSGVDALSKQEGSFTFDIRPLGGLSTGDSGKDLQSFPRMQAGKLSLTGEGSPSTTSSSQTDVMTVKKISLDSSLIPGGCPPSGGLTGPSERKTRRSTGRSGKGSAKKGNQVKETTPLRKAERGDKSSVSLSPLEAGRLMAFGSAVKPAGNVSTPTSSLPDLNSSAPSSAFFHQPFTDLQQVQLRAQIFVYGSLIQGAAPDEACMVSAFDGSKSVWEPSWRTCVQKLHGQKSKGNNDETPAHSRSGAKAPDQINNRQCVSQSEVLSPVTGRASNMAIRSPVVNSMIPLSSPLWSISTPSCGAVPSSSMVRGTVLDYQTVSPLRPYQTPPIRNFVAQTTWPSQPPFQLPWLASSSQSSPFDISSKFSAFPHMEPVKLTPVKESSLPIISGGKQVSPIPATNTGPTTMFAGASLDLKTPKLSAGQTDAKARKRKKSSGAEDVVQISVTAPVADSISAPVVADHSSKKAPAAVEDLSKISLTTPVSHYSTSTAVTTPSSLVPTGMTNQFLSAMSPLISSDHLNRGDLSMNKRSLDMDGFSKVEEAKLQAEEAAAHAATAISHCEDVWGQLYRQKNSGLTSDAESKLASAAVAIAAAASVAKAAAAAAKIASSAALQAKQMADEAVTKPGIVSTIDSPNNLANTPSLAISAAREASRKKVEAASAATRQAENLDAIVKAAELAAEAVAHAGKIVTMGDPFSLSELVETGPYSYWKVSHVASVPGSEPNDMNQNKSINSNAGKVPDVFMNQHEEPDKDTCVTSQVVSSTERELSKNMMDDHVRVQEKHGETNLPQKDKRVSESAKTAGVVSEPDIPNSHESISSIREGSLVEVLQDRGDLKRAWLSASVLSLKDGEALVCYTKLQSDEGSEQLKEWASLEAKGGDAPKVRIPHPMTAVQFEGTRKRRRAAVKDYTWSVGDKVDAWVQDCWREGIVAENNKKDATALSVHLPGLGEPLMVKMWHLRPTVIWRDGQWIEWSRPGECGTTSQGGDTPVEKRQKLVSMAIDKGKGKMAKNIDFVEKEKNEEPVLPLSASEKVFNIGGVRDDNNKNKPNTVRAVRSGLGKEGSSRGVVFGVPKPGKKRKFMDVSKHYVSDRSSKTNNVPNDDSVKLAKFRNNNSKLDLKGKQVAESKLKPVRPGKPPSIPIRTLPKKDDSTSSRPNSRDASNDDENESGEQTLAEIGSSSSNAEGTSGGTMVFSARAGSLNNRKKAATAATRSVRSERLNRGRVAPTPARVVPAQNEEANENVIPENSEPRRSNRRIQPTSRLLEGLQSSLIPSFSHSQGHRSQNRGPARGNVNRG